MYSSFCYRNCVQSEQKAKLGSEESDLLDIPIGYKRSPLKILFVDRVNRFFELKSQNLVVFLIRLTRKHDGLNSEISPSYTSIYSPLDFMIPVSMIVFFYYFDSKDVNFEI